MQVCGSDSGSDTTHICVLEGRGSASDYAAQLLISLGAPVRRTFQHPDLHPDLAWARSGAMALTGHRDGPPQCCPAPLASCVEGVRSALLSLAGEAFDLPDARTLGERASFSGLRRNGAISPGGACHLLPTADGWLAVNLPRPEDWQLTRAWLEAEEPPLQPGQPEPWDELARRLATQSQARLCERAALLGLAVAPLGACKKSSVRNEVQGARSAANDAKDTLQPDERPKSVPPWFHVVAQGTRRPANRTVRQPPRVIDLSALWAGPLCTHLLHQMGMQVIKVESHQRPDGARRGPQGFFDLMNQGKASVALDFSDPRDIARLRALLQRADIVIESSRPRGLRQLGIEAEELIHTTPGLSWLSINGYGRDPEHENRIAYGDDAGVAGGLSALLLAQTGEVMFCGDAIADPLTGWHAALAAFASYQSGGGQLISLALCDVVSHCAAQPMPASRVCIAPEHIALPHARKARTPARPMGADSARILSEAGM